MPASLHSAPRAFLMSTTCPELLSLGKTNSLRLLDALQQPDRRLRQRRDVFGFLLGGRAGFAPDAAVEIEVGPAHRQHLAAPCAGQQQQANALADWLVGMRVSAAVSRASSSPGEVALALVSGLRSMPRQDYRCAIPS